MSHAISPYVSQGSQNSNYHRTRAPGELAPQNLSPVPQGNWLRQALRSPLPRGIASLLEGVARVVWNTPGACQQ